MRYKRPSLFVTMLLPVVLVSIILAAAFSVVAVIAIKQSTDQALQERLSLAQATARHIDNILGQILTSIEASTKLTGIAQPVPRDYYESLTGWLPVPLVFVSGLDLEGNVLWTEPEQSQVTKTSFLDAPQVREVLANGRDGVSGVVSDILPDRTLIFFAVPKKDDAGGIVAIIQAAVDLNRAGLDEWIKPLAAGQTGYSQLVDKQGTILATTQSHYFLATAQHGPQFAALIARGTTAQGQCHSCHSGEAPRQDILAFAPLVRAPWGVAIQQAEDEVFAPAQQLQQRFLVAGAIAFLAGLIATGVAARYVVRPVKRMVTASERIASGDLSQPIAAPGGPIELSSLAISFESMREALKTAQEKQARWQDELERRVAGRTRELMSLVQASESLVSSLDPQTLLTSTVEIALEAFGADIGSLFLYDSKEQALAPSAAVGYDLESLSKVRLLPGEGIAGKAFLSGQTAFSNEPADARALLENLSSENRRLLATARGDKEVLAYLAVPLVFRSRVTGILFLASLHPGKTFLPAGRQLAEAFGRLASSLLENVRLLQQAREAEALHEADKLKTDFLSNISHELKTPVASLRASLEFLAPTAADEASEMQARLISNARRNAQRLQKLVNDLIDIARLQNLQLKLELETLDLRQVIRDTAENFELAVRNKEQTLEVVVPDQPVLVRGDEQRLAQAVDNFMSNATQYAPKGAHITLGVQHTAGRAIVSIADNGPGIAREAAEKLFQRFQRGPTANAPCLGLGLVIAKGLVELHHGKVWFKSEPGKGSVFGFSLPEVVDQ